MTPRENDTQRRVGDPEPPGRRPYWALWLLALISAVPVGTRAVQYYQTPKFGELCLKGCRSGFCYKVWEWSGYCTHHCSEATDCPPAYSCVEAGDVHFCRRDPVLEFGERCSAPEECKSDQCVRFTMRDPQRGHFSIAYCSNECTTDEDCVADAVCEEGAYGGQCKPVAIFERDMQRRLDVEKRLGMTNPRDYWKSAPANGSGAATSQVSTPEP